MATGVYLYFLELVRPPGCPVAAQQGRGCCSMGLPWEVVGAPWREGTVSGCQASWVALPVGQRFMWGSLGHLWFHNVLLVVTDGECYLREQVGITMRPFRTSSSRRILQGVWVSECRHGPFLLLFLWSKAALSGWDWTSRLWWPLLSTGVCHGSGFPTVIMALCRSAHGDL